MGDLASFRVVTPTHQRKFGPEPPAVGGVLQAARTRPALALFSADIGASGDHGAAMLTRFCGIRIALFDYRRIESWPVTP